MWPNSQEMQRIGKGALIPLVESVTVAGPDMMLDMLGAIQSMLDGVQTSPNGGIY